jgi:hypothetical protein
MSQLVVKFTIILWTESGDLTLFGRGNRPILGTPGCTKAFMLGVACVPYPAALNADLEALRQELLNDPKYNHLRSMQRNAGKTARQFHAKDDHPSIRSRVFEVLAKQDGLYAMVAIRQKQVFIDGIHKRIASGEVASFGRQEHNDIYDKLLIELLQGSFHKAERNEIVFAKRGKSSRTEALRNATETAKRRLLKRCQHAADSQCTVQVTQPDQHGGLQAIDYLLWAFGRGGERGDWQAYSSVSHLYAHVHDKDRGTKNAGTHYGRKRKPFVPQNGTALW